METVALVPLWQFFIGLIEVGGLPEILLLFYFLFNSVPVNLVRYALPRLGS